MHNIPVKQLSSINCNAGSDALRELQILKSHWKGETVIVIWKGNNVVHRVSKHRTVNVISTLNVCKKNTTKVSEQYGFFC